MILGRRRLVAGSLAAALLPGCRRGADGLAVPTITVERKRFARTVEAEGHLKPVQATVVNAPRSPEGPMRITWLAQDGATVKKGQVLARFDDLELRSSLQTANDERTTSTTKKQKEGLMLAQARSDRQRTTEAAQRELAMARAFQRKDAELYSRDDIVTSEIDEKLQNARADHARHAQKVDGQVARRKLQILEVEAKKAAEAIARAEQGLKQLESLAPHDGVLVYRRNFRGETLAVGDQAWGSIFEVSQSEKLEAEVFVLEVEAAGLAKGKKAELRLESHPGQVWQAQVSRVETVAKRRQFRSPTQYFGVTLTLTKTETAVMKPGQRVRAKLLLDERDAIVVPRPALFDKDGKWVAYRRQGTGFVPVPVKLGASTAGLVAIDGGLQAGDVIALRDPGQTLDELLSGGRASSGKGR